MAKSKLDLKFEKMSRECANSMTGTGTGLKRSTQKVKKTKKSNKKK